MDESLLFSVRLSFQVAITATLFVAVLGFLTAYFLATRNFPGKTVVETFIMLPLILPPTVIGYYLIFLLGRNGIIGNPVYRLTEWSFMFTWWAAAVASFIVAFPLMVKTSQAAIESVDKSMLDTSYMLGYTEFQTVRKVIIPLAFKGIGAGIILAFARAMGEFGATLMVAGNIPGKTNTMPLSIYTFASCGEWSKVNLLVGIQSATAILFLVIVSLLGKKRKIV